MSQLQRHIGLRALIFYGVGDILGAGIYGLVGKAAGEMGHAIWLAFLMSMVAAGLTGLSYASLGSRYSKAGGAAYLAHRAFGNRFLAYVVGLAALCSGVTSMATASRAFAGYFKALVGNLPAEVVVTGFCLFLCAVVLRGIRESMWVNIVCTTIELSGLLLVLAVGARYLGGVNYLDAVTVSNPSGSITVPLILSGAVLTFYSFIGFEDIINVSEEVQDPARNIPKGILYSVGISSLIYIGISLVSVSVIAPVELAKSSAPLVDVVGKAAPWFPAIGFTFIALFAVANTALLNFIMGSRLVYGMANDGLLPKVLGRVSARRKTPHVATLAILVLMLALALSGDVSSLARSTSVLLLLCFVVVNLALIVLKRRQGESRGGFEVPYVVPVLGVAVCLAMLAAVKAEEARTAAILLVGIVALYFAKSRIQPSR
jgi:basic amino acid/polyamine antiporter, APA family